MKVILLEDDDGQAACLEQYLHTFQAETEGVSFAVTRFARALPLLESYRCDADLLLLDIRLPDMEGMEAARRIREIDGNAAIVFVPSLQRQAGAGDTAVRPSRKRRCTVAPLPRGPAPPARCRDPVSGKRQP